VTNGARLHNKFLPTCQRYLLPKSSFELGKNAVHSYETFVTGYDTASFHIREDSTFVITIVFKYCIKSLEII